MKPQPQSAIGYESMMAALAQGDRLQLTRLHDPKPEDIYSLVDSGRRVNANAAHKAIRLGQLAPVKDGLFGDSQTWSLATA